MIIIIFYEDIKHTCAQLSPKLETDFSRTSDPNPLPLYTTTEVTVHRCQLEDACKHVQLSRNGWKHTLTF